MAKKDKSFSGVKTGADLVDYAVSKGAHVEHGSKATKVSNERGSFLVNESKELSKPDKSHFKRILLRLGLLLIAGMLFLEIVLPIFGWHVVWF